MPEALDRVPFSSGWAQNSGMSMGRRQATRPASYVEGDAE